MLYSAVAQINFIALVAVTLVALAAGDRLVRLTSVIVAVNWVLVSLLQKRHSAHLVFQTGDFLADLGCAVPLVTIAILSRRGWSAGIAAFQVLGVVNYLVVLFDKRVLHRAFWTLAYVWEYGILAMLLWGTVVAIRSRCRARALPSD